MKKSQLSLIDFFEQIKEPQVLPEEKKYDITRELSSLNDYHSRRGLPTSLLDITYDISKVNSFDYMLQRIKLSFTRPRLREAKTAGDVQAVFDEILGDSTISVSVCNYAEHSPSMAKLLQREVLNNPKSERFHFRDIDFIEYCNEKSLLLKVVVSDESSTFFNDEYVYEVVGPVRTSLRKKRTDAVIHLKSGANWHCLLKNIDELLAELYMIAAVRSYLSNDSNLIIAEDAMIRGFMRSMKKEIELPSEFIDTTFSNAFERNGIKCNFIGIGCKAVDYERFVRQNPFLYSLLTNGLSALNFDSINAHTYDYNISIGDKKLVNFSLRNTMYFRFFLTSILSEMLNQSASLRTRHKSLGEDHTSYARSYEQKKNIPQKVLQVMKDTILKNYFTNVELDELTDLKLFSFIENEIMDFMDMILECPLDGYDLRFKRLGQHKASGLFYPALRNLLVDVRNVGSFCHEMWHLLDFREDLNYTMSDSLDFTSIIIRYKEIVNKTIDNLPEGNSTKKAFGGKSKYNQSYYFDNTEIFARCGEIYLHRIVGYEGSLLEFKKGVFYPDDLELNNLITDYYDSRFFMLSKVNNNKNELTKKEAS